MTGGILINDSPVEYDDVRPIAKIAEDYDVVIVPADSPVESIEDLLAEWSADPKGHPWTGGSAGSLDHLVVAQLALAGGLDAGETTFIPKSGGGEAIQALLNGTADYAATGYNEVSDQIEAGRVRAVGVTRWRSTAGGPAVQDSAASRSTADPPHRAGIPRALTLVSPPRSREPPAFIRPHMKEDVRADESWWLSYGAGRTRRTGVVPASGVRVRRRPTDPRSAAPNRRRAPRSHLPVLHLRTRTHRR